MRLLYQTTGTGSSQLPKRDRMRKRNTFTFILVAMSQASEAFVLTPASFQSKRIVDMTISSQSKTSVVQESSANRFAGAGPSQVDMNIYNLNLDDIAEQWTANLVAASPLQEEGVYLGAKNAKEILVDTVKVQFPRGSSLGIELIEIAGGREDGLGITIVSGLVQGGAAEGSGILPGDSISKVEVVRKETSSESGSMTESETVFAVATECLGYDRTVDAIVSLPPLDSEHEMMVLTIKRLRRKPKVTLKLQYPPEMKEPDVSLELFSGENLRRAMLVRGVKLNDPLARRFDNGGSGDCGAEGTCATCAVSVVRGQDLLNPAGSTEQQIFRKNPRWRLACKAIVGYGMKEGELVVRVSPRQWAN